MRAPVASGIVVPVITPFDTEEHIYEIALRRVVEYVLVNGVHGLFAMTSTGESVALSDREWARGIDIISQQANGRVPVLAGVSAAGTGLAIARAQEAERLGVDGIVSTLPFYYRLERNEMVDHYRELANATHLPIYAYDMPLTKMSFSEEMVADLVGIDRIVGLKDSSNDFTLFQKLVARFSGRLSMFQGNETMIAHSLFAGAGGGVLGLANVAPRLCADLFEACATRNYERAYVLQRRLVSLHYISRVGPNPLTGVKCAMELLGFGSDRMTRPMRPLSPAQKEIVRHWLVKLELIH